jgi:hypothetical protein
MAGLGRKVFAPGEVLTATNVQNYLMDQAVQVYAGTAARGSAIGTATTDGMVTWLQDTDQLQVATGTATWADVSFAQSPNAIINGAFDIWQRGTSSTTPGYTTADRWSSGWDGTGVRTISRQPFTLGAAPLAGYEFAYFYRFAQSTAGTGGTYNNFAAQSIESVRTFAGQVVTLSFWAKADATRTITPILQQSFGTGGSPSGIVYYTGSAISLTTSWVRYSQTFSLLSISGKTLGTSGNDALIVTLQSALNNATQTIDIWGLQLEAGSVATPFRRNANSIQGELAACQRYFIASPTTGNTYGMSGNVTNGSGYVAYAVFPVPMRATPTTVTITNGAITSGFPTTPASAAGITSFGFYEIRTANATTNGYFGGNYTANAEL